MFLRPNHRSKDGKGHTYWSLVESVRTPDGPRQRTLCHLGELNGSDHARWVKTVEVFNEQGEAQQLKLFPAHVAAPVDDPQVARVLIHRVRLERTRQFGVCYLGLELWNWTDSSNRRLMTILPMCLGRAWRRCWRSTACAHQAANWPSSNAGIQRRR
jgi:hypothetical protein